VRRLVTERTPAMIDAWNIMRKHLNGLPYEQSRLKLIKSAGFGENKYNMTQLFCSELVAEAYMRAGLVERTANPGNFTPEDFSFHKLNLRRGSMEQEIQIIRTYDKKTGEMVY